VKNVLDRIEGVLAARRERLRKRQYLHTIKERNRLFLEQYRAIRADLEAWLQNRGIPVEGSAPAVAVVPNADR